MIGTLRVTWLPNRDASSSDWYNLANQHYIAGWSQDYWSWRLLNTLGSYSRCHFSHIFRDTAIVDIPKVGNPNSTRTLSLITSWKATRLIGSTYPLEWHRRDVILPLSTPHTPKAFWLSNYYHTVKHLQTSSFTLSPYTYFLKQDPLWCI